MDLPITIPSAVAPILGLIVAVISAYLGSRSERGKRAAIQFETELRRIVDRRLGIPTPSTQELSEDDLDDALVEAIPAYDGSSDPVDVVYSDGIWLAPDPADVDLLQSLTSATQWLPYRPERFDCENFAAAFRTLSAFVAGSNTVGVVYDWSSEHAYNVLVDSSGEVYIYEPQDDRTVDIGEEKYELENALIVF